MKTKYIALTLAVLSMASCSKKSEYDAEGFFEATEVIVSAESNGKLMQFDVEEGDTLAEFQQVGIIDTLQLALKVRQLGKQRSSVISSTPDIPTQAAALRSQIAQAKREQHRAQNLVTDGAAPQKQLDDANSQVATLQGQLDALLSNLNNNTVTISENASSVDLQIAQIQDQISKCRISSPINGIVLSKYANRGEIATTGRPLFKISNLDHIWLRAYVTSAQLADLRLGQKVKVYADYGGSNTQEYDGTLTWIASESEFTPKNVQTQDSRANLVYAVKISIKNDGKLKLGFYGGVKF